MNYRLHRLCPEARACEKQASRDRDAVRLARGEVSRDELSRENSFFDALDVANFEIVAIGNRPFGGEET